MPRAWLQALPPGALHCAGSGGLLLAGVGLLDMLVQGVLTGPFVKRIGDRRTEATALEAASPRRRISENTSPGLLVHGDEDRVVRNPILPEAQRRRLFDLARVLSEAA